MKHILIAFTFFLSLGGLAKAQSTYPANAYYADNALSTISPCRGVYYDGKTPGTAIRVDLGASGKAVITIYMFDASGAPIWYLTQGTYVPSDEVTRWTTGVVGTMTTTPSPLRTVVQCPNCLPITGAMQGIGPVTLSWVNSREVKMTSNGTAWDLTAPNIDTGSDGDYLSGSWATTLIFAYVGANPFSVLHFHTAMSAPLTMVPVAHPILIAPTTKNITNYTPDAVAYITTCGLATVSEAGAQLPQEPGFDTLCKWYNGYLPPAVTGYRGVTINPSQVMIFWYSKASNRFGVDVGVLQQVNRISTYVIGPKGFHADLYLQGPNTLTGRGMIQGEQRDYDGFVNGELGLAITMTKLPDAAATQ